MRKPEERVEVAVRVNEQRRIPCVCREEKPVKVDVKSLSMEGALPRAEVVCKSCGHEWVRYG